MPLRLDTRSPDFAASFHALLAMKREAAEDVDQAAATIIAEVIARGDDCAHCLFAKIRFCRS